MIEVDKCEADDVIAVASKVCYQHNIPVMIVSGDRDFKQLQFYDNVKQYAPVLKEHIVVADPDLERRTKIITGDAGDGVPNILSDDDTFVNPAKRQKPMTAKRLQQYLWADVATLPEPVQKAIERNRKMIDLIEHQMPPDLKEEIRLKVLTPPKGNSKLIYTYLAQNKMVRLLENAQELI